jgi:hypothetical protein
MPTAHKSEKFRGLFGKHADDCEKLISTIEKHAVL